MDKDYTMSKEEILDLTSVIYEDESLRVSHTRIIGATETIIMFPFARVHLGSTESIGFYRLADKNVIYIVDKNNSWFNDFTPELVLSIIDTLIKDQELYIVGISMGAFNAIHFSNFIKVKRCIAIAPQKSISRNINHRNEDINLAVKKLFRRNPRASVLTVTPSKDCENIIFWGSNSVEKVHSRPMLKELRSRKIPAVAVVFRDVRHDVVGNLSKLGGHKRHIIYEKLVGEELNSIIKYYTMHDLAAVQIT